MTRRIGSGHALADAALFHLDENMIWQCERCIGQREGVIRFELKRSTYSR